MIRWATVTEVTDEGVWVVSSWLQGVTGPLPVTGSPAAGDPVLVLRTSEGELAAIRGGGEQFLPLAGGNLTGPVRFGPSGALTIDYVSGWSTLTATGNNIRIRAGLTELIIGYSSSTAPGYVQTNRPTLNTHPPNAMATKGYVDAIKTALSVSTDFADFKTRVAAL